MKTTHQRAFLLILTIFVLVTSLFNTGKVFADDSAPPVEPVGTETPIVTDVLPVAEETSPITADQTSPKPVPVSEVLKQLPEDTQITVLNENGDVLPLATQHAAEILVESDPMWCPAGVTPGGVGCTASYATVTDLIANLGSKSGAGTIYFTSTYSVNDAVFDGANPYLWHLKDLTIQGGWNGLIGSAFALSGSTAFNGIGLKITNWNSIVTINNVIVGGANGMGINVGTTGDIVLTDVSSDNNSGVGAYLDNHNGTGNVILTGTNTFTNNAEDGLGVWSNGDINVSNITADNNIEYGTYLDTTGNVILSGINTFSNNGDYGLIGFSDGSITLNNVTANNNDGTGVALANDEVVVLNGSNFFNDNGASGLEVFSSGEISLNNITANNNYGVGALLRNEFGTSRVTLIGVNTFINNESNGLYIMSSGSINLNDVTASNNLTGLYLNNTYGSESINLTGSNIFNNNYDGSGYGYGLIAYSNGNINLNNITASNNGVLGLYLENRFGVSNIAFSGNNKFNNNGWGGIDVFSAGNIGLENVTANGNGYGGGAILETTGNVCVSESQFNSNSGIGIWAGNVSGSLTLNNVSFDGLNGGGNYSYSGIPIITNEGCKSPSVNINQPTNIKETKDTLVSALPFQVVRISNSGSAGFDCVSFIGTVLILPNGDNITFKCPIESAGSLSLLSNDGLPGALPDGVEYVSGMQTVQIPNGSDKALDGQVIVSFLIPENMKSTELAILYWDGSQWVDLKSASFKDGRVVINGGHITGDGYFEAVTNFSGNFVLVKK